MHFYITLNQFLYSLSVVMSALFSNKVFVNQDFKEKNSRRHKKLSKQLATWHLEFV